MFSNEQIQMIRNEHDNFEKTKEIPDNILELIYDQKLFKLFVPEALGGRMLDLPNAIDIFQEASRIDGNFGWIVTIGSGGGMFVPNMKEEAAHNYYSPKNAVISGSGFPAGTAEPTDNGYIISGKWFYCSGSQYANGFTATCFVNHDNKGEKEIIAAVLNPEEVNVIEDWDAFGLKGTSSHSIKITDQFIPHERIFSVFENQNSFSDIVHSFPFVMFSEASFAAISLGIGQHFLEEVSELLEKNKENWQKNSNNRYTFLNKKLTKEIIRWNKANDYFHEMVHSTWNKHSGGEELTELLQKEFSIIAKRSVATSISCVDELFRYVGMQAVMESSSLNEIWRDLHTASQHMFLIPANEIEATPY